MLVFRISLAVLCFASYINCQVDWSDDENPEKWFKYSGERIKRILSRRPNGNVAKNIIFFLGDGMGPTTVTAGRIAKGQKSNRNGEEEITNMENLDYLALSKTYNIDAQTPDSAGTATAFLTGVKTRIGVIGLDGTAENCPTSKGKQVDSILDWAHYAGKSTGIVTTTRITHATPSGAYGHVYNRDWETFDDSFRPIYEQGCRDLASQLVDDNSFINVIFGGGRRKFLKTDTKDFFADKYGERVDGRDLIAEWTKKPNHKFVWNLNDFNSLKPTATPDEQHVLGLFNYDHLEFDIDRVENNVEEPTLTNMTQKAIELLKTNQNGFFLLVEGGRIDHGHHESKAKKSLYDFIAFDEAIGKALEMINLDETLVLVSADHSHVFTLGGYANRGNPLFNIVVSREEALTSDKLTYTALLYGNGPGFKDPVRRVNLSNEVTSNKEYIQESAVPISSESHGGEDVAIFASGPMAYLFDGTVEQSHIAHVMAYSACIGPYNATKYPSCRSDRGVLIPARSVSSSLSFSNWLTFGLLSFVICLLSI